MCSLVWLKRGFRVGRLRLREAKMTEGQEKGVKRLQGAGLYGGWHWGIGSSKGRRPFEFAAAHEVFSRM